MTDSGTYVYDAENRLIWTSGERYLYDGDGKRVEKCAVGSATTACPTSGTGGTLYWRGTGDDTLDESDLSGNPQEEYVFFNGKRIARRDVTSTGATIAVHYYFSDHLGSHSAITDATGTLLEQDIEFYPYGGVEHDYCTACVAQNYKFTGKERDTESGLDNFGARFDASTLGRFMTPDWAASPTAVPYANFGDPQSLNLYSYVENAPVNRADAFGHQDCSGVHWLECHAPKVAQALAEAETSMNGTATIDTKAKVAKPPKLNGTNPVTGQDGLATNPTGVPGNMRPGTGGQGYFGASRGGSRRHKGFDISGRSHFDMVMSWNDGTVEKLGSDPNGYGTYLDVSHDDGTTSRYAHLSAVGVERGEGVVEGEILGVVGQTGNAGANPVSESHVHFEIRRDNVPIDPRSMMNQAEPPEN